MIDISSFIRVLVAPLIMKSPKDYELINKVISQVFGSALDKSKKAFIVGSVSPLEVDVTAMPLLKEFEEIVTQTMNLYNPIFVVLTIGENCFSEEQLKNIFVPIFAKLDIPFYVGDEKHVLEYLPGGGRDEEIPSVG